MECPLGFLHAGFWGWRCSPKILVPETTAAGLCFTTFISSHAFQAKGNAERNPENSMGRTQTNFGRVFIKYTLEIEAQKWHLTKVVVVDLEVKSFCRSYWSSTQSSLAILLPSLTTGVWESFPP